MTQEIIALNNLYTRTKKEFSEIKSDNADSELQQMDFTLQSIKGYFDGLLNVIPKDISIYFDDRLQIRPEKTFLYDTKDSKNNTMPIVLLEDKYAFHEHSVLDRTYEGLFFGYGDEITTVIQPDTLEYLTANWAKIKKSVVQHITKELKTMIKEQIDMLCQKIQFLEILENWRV
ncbi:MAG: hypothetical protein HFI57_04320 [Lachnospiraceae bacterium]|nr:hypothetical protein [Lachnospiraceae bacterium]